LLPDAGHLQEEAARHANARGYSKHEPALPLYTDEDARASLSRFEPLEFRKAHTIASRVDLAFLPAGHILGASIAALQAPGLRLVFSGALGRLRRLCAAAAWS
jgi:metallo-beta-lactamase family protein